MKGEFTGTYYRCTQCKHIYDFNDICPDCGCDKVEDINPNDIRSWYPFFIDRERARLEKMLQSHCD